MQELEQAKYEYELLNSQVQKQISVAARGKQIT